MAKSKYLLLYKDIEYSYEYLGTKDQLNKRVSDLVAMGLEIKDILFAGKVEEQYEYQVDIKVISSIKL